MMQPRAAAQLLITVASLGTLLVPAMAQVDSGYQNREEREIFSTNPAGDSGAILDATNPMDLINRIQRAGAMNDATPPSDAIDAALREFQQGPKEAVAQP